MEKETKKRLTRGDFVGRSIIDGTSYDIFSDKCHFGLKHKSKFVRHVKASTLRASGIFVDKKKIYGQNGFTGCPRR